MNYIPYRIFEGTSQILQTAWCEISGSLRPKLHEIKNSVAAVGNDYTASLAVGGPNFPTAARRFAYALRGIAPHARWSYSILDTHSSKIAPILNQPNSTVWSLGGGPGTDLLALLTCYEKWNCRGHVTYINFDREVGWRSSLECVKAIAARRNLPFDFELVSDGDTAVSAIQKHGKADLVLTIYSLSDFYSRHGTVDHALKTALANARIGALAVFVDISNSKFVPWSDSIFRGAGYELENWRDYDDFGMEFWEWSRCVGLYGQLFDLRPPRGRVCHRLWRQAPAN